MNILFIGTTGIHHVLLAAHQYLEINESDLRRLKHWGDRAGEASGQPLYVDRDREGNRVFTVGVGRNIAMAEKSISQLLQMLMVTDQEMLVRPIYSRYDRLWLWLNRLDGWSLTRAMVGKLIVALLHRESSQLKRQIEQIKNEVR
jgi:hypothetical protein